MAFLINILTNYGQPLDEEITRILGRSAPDQVLAYLQHCPIHTPTPLHALADEAEKMGIASVFLKDEGQRLNLRSFKALGATYALMREVQRLASEKMGREVLPSELLEPEVKAVAKEMVFGCATDGNHGRSLAAGARLLGVCAHIFVHQEVSENRIAAMQAFGAAVRVVKGNYDDSVDEAARVCAENGWQVLSDTSWKGYRRIPFYVMQGYSMIIHEALAQMDTIPTHVFIQAGVGGMVGAIAAYLQDRFGAARPKIVVIEPETAACCLESIKAGKIIQIKGDKSVMGMLECFVPSEIAFSIMERCAEYFLSIPDQTAIAAMRTLAHREPRIIAGESGVSGFAALCYAHQQDLFAAMEIDKNSQILLINSEGATDLELYAHYTGINP